MNKELMELSFITMTKEELEYEARRLLSNYLDAIEENGRLNNIINELEKWLKENIGICRTNINYTTNQIFNLKEDTYYRCLNKLKELKGE